MVAFNLSFVELAELYNYQIQNVVYDLYNDQARFELISYFPGFPRIKVTIKYFNIGSNPKYSIAISDTDDIEYRMTPDTEISVEDAAKDVANTIKDILEKEIKDAKINKKHKRILVSGPL